MPELPEVETTVRKLESVLKGQRLSRVIAFRADLRRPFPLGLAQRLTGARVIRLYRRAKYGVITTDRLDAMIFHLGMSGRWRIEKQAQKDQYEQAAQKHDHMLLATESGYRLYLRDPRRFGAVDLVSGDPEDSFAPFRALGPEPLSDDFNTVWLAERFKNRKTAVKTLLLDQKIGAGLGNIYVCEALNKARIHPASAGGSLSRRRLCALVSAIKEVLRAAIDVGGSTLRDFLQPDDELGYFASQWRVYHREGEACPCGGSIMRIVQAGRASFFCPECQC